MKFLLLFLCTEPHPHSRIQVVQMPKLQYCRCLKQLYVPQWQSDRWVVLEADITVLIIMEKTFFFFSFCIIEGNFHNCTTFSFPGDDCFHEKYKGGVTRSISGLYIKRPGMICRNCQNWSDTSGIINHRNCHRCILVHANVQITRCFLCEPVCNNSFSLLLSVRTMNKVFYFSA